MNITHSVDDEVVLRDRQQTEVLRTTSLAGTSDGAADLDEFERLSREANGNSDGWKFNREEIHERRMP